MCNRYNNQLLFGLSPPTKIILIKIEINVNSFFVKIY